VNRKVSAIPIRDSDELASHDENMTRKTKAHIGQCLIGCLSRLLPFLSFVIDHFPIRKIPFFRQPRVLTVLVVGAFVACACTEARAQIDLGAADSFGVLGDSTVTSAGVTYEFGNLGVSPGTAVTGFPPGTILGGSLQGGTSLASQAQANAMTAYHAHQ
jgi:hypothetical protein